MLKNLRDNRQGRYRCDWGYRILVRPVRASHGGTEAQRDQPEISIDSILHTSPCLRAFVRTTLKSLSRGHRGTKRSTRNSLKPNFLSSVPWCLSEQQPWDDTRGCAISKFDTGGGCAIFWIWHRGGCDKLDSNRVWHSLKPRKSRKIGPQKLGTKFASLLLKALDTESTRAGLCVQQ